MFLALEPPFFFTRGLLDLIVLYTNIKSQDRKLVPSLSKHPANAPGLYTCDWVDITIQELYTYLSILICIALNPINDIEQYWNQTQSYFKYIVDSMTCNRF
jgi:hypothetical protein